MRWQGITSSEPTRFGIAQRWNPDLGVSGGGLYWLPYLGRSTICSREGFLSQYERLDLIAPAEIDEAILWVARKALGISVVDARAEALRVLGFSRITTDRQNEVVGRIRGLVEYGELRMEGGLVTVA